MTMPPAEKEISPPYKLMSARLVPRPSTWVIGHFSLRQSGASPSPSDTAPSHEGSIPWPVRYFLPPEPSRSPNPSTPRDNSLERGQSHNRLLNPLVAHDASPQGGPDLEGPALAHSSAPAGPIHHICRCCPNG